LVAKPQGGSCDNEQENIIRYSYPLTGSESDNEVINGSEDYFSSDDDVPLSSMVSSYEWKKNVDVMSTPVFC
jgi:hypothetical protein